MIVKSIIAVISIFIMIGIGAFATKKDWLNKSVSQFIPKIIVNVSLPCQIIVTFFSTFTKQQIIDSWVYIAAGFVASITCCIIAYLISYLIKIPDERRGIFCVLFSLSNSVFIGFPIASAIFGNAGMPYATYFYIANTVCYWTFGFYMTKRDAAVIRGEKVQFSIGNALKRILSVPIVMIALSITLIMFNVSMPELVTKTASIMGGLTTPLASMFLGYILYDMVKKGALKYQRGMVAYVLGRFPISFALMYASCMLFGITGMARNVLLTQMSLPAMIQTVIGAELTGADGEYAASGLAVTTLLSFITIPLFSFLGA